MVKVETLGASGGSVCHVDAGAREAGPGSAGSQPGPICCGRGGTNPTITDALLMPGILSAEAEFAGGSFALTRAGVEEALKAPADALDLERMAALWGELGANAARYFADAGFALEQVTARYQLNMRYPGRTFVLTIDVEAKTGLGELGFVDETLGVRAIAAFDARHMADYGHPRA